MSLFQSEGNSGYRVLCMGMPLLMEVFDHMFHHELYLSAPFPTGGTLRGNMLPLPSQMYHMCVYVWSKFNVGSVANQESECILIPPAMRHIAHCLLVGRSMKDAARRTTEMIDGWIAQVQRTGDTECSMMSTEHINYASHISLLNQRDSDVLNRLVACIGALAAYAPLSVADLVSEFSGLTLKVRLDPMDNEAFLYTRTDRIKLRSLYRDEIQPARQPTRRRLFSARFDSADGEDDDEVESGTAMPRMPNRVAFAGFGPAAAARNMPPPPAPMRAPSVMADTGLLPPALSERARPFVGALPSASIRFSMTTAGLQPLSLPPGGASLTAPAAGAADVDESTQLVDARSPSPSLIDMPSASDAVGTPVLF